MTDQPFVDFYDLLQLSPTADDDTSIASFATWRRSATRTFPRGGDPERFRRLVQAHGTLDRRRSREPPTTRQYQDYWNRKWRVASEASDGSAFAEDHDTREKLLSLLYVQRRRDMRSPGLGEYEMARLLRVPVELVEFHLWYLREKGWVQRIDNGQLAISANGVDSIEGGPAPPAARSPAHDARHRRQPPTTAMARVRPASERRALQTPRAGTTRLGVGRIRRARCHGRRRTDTTRRLPHTAYFSFRARNAKANACM